MGVPYSQDLRLRVLEALDGGLSKMTAHKTFRVARSTIDDWVKLRATTGHVAATTRYHRGTLPAIWDLVVFEEFATRHCYSTLEAMKAAWHQEQGQLLSINTFSVAMKRIGWTHKKRVGSMPSVWEPSAPSDAPSSSKL
jgi:transposase